MYLGKIFLTENNRIRLSQVLCALYFVDLLISITILAFGAHMKIAILKLKHIFTGYDDDTLPYMFIGVGLLSIVAKILTGLACFATHSFPNRQKVSVILRVLCLVNFGLGVTLLVAAIMCFAHTEHLSEAFDRGLRQSMAEYAYNPKIKTELDELQMNYKCCGNKGHEDWFNIGWILDKFHEPLPDIVNKQHILPQSYFNKFKRETAPELEGPATIQAAAPFSCCDPSAVRPCVNRDITNKLKHALYDYTSHTLYKKGCREVIMDYLGGTILTAGGVFAITTFFIELFLLLMTRYLQTSIQVAINNGFYDLTTPGYLIDCICIVEHHPDELLYQSPSFPNSTVPEISYSASPAGSQIHASDAYQAYMSPDDFYNEYPSDTFQDSALYQPYQQGYGSFGDYGDNGNFGDYGDYGNFGDYGSFGNYGNFSDNPTINSQYYDCYDESGELNGFGDDNGFDNGQDQQWNGDYIPQDEILTYEPSFDDMNPDEFMFDQQEPQFGIMSPEQQFAYDEQGDLMQPSDEQMLPGQYGDYDDGGGFADGEGFGGGFADGEGFGGGFADGEENVEFDDMNGLNMGGEEFGESGHNLTQNGQSDVAMMGSDPVVIPSRRSLFQNSAAFVGEQQGGGESLEMLQMPDDDLFQSEFQEENQ